MPLFQQVELAERYDLAIMSTKGMSVTAARELLDRICRRHSVPLLVLHDFDKAGSASSERCIGAPGDIGLIPHSR
jgi:hypothetical protein